MTESDKVEFVKIVLGLKAVKPGAPLSDEGLELFWNALREGWELADFKAAANHLARSSEFMPNPFHFEQLRKAVRRTSADAFAIARACWRSGGRSTGDALIDRAVAGLGGYEACGMTQTDKLSFLERRFAEHYADLQDVEEVRQAVPQIAASALRLGRLRQS